MPDKPITFSGPMVRALIEGRKTQTRRVIKNVPPQPAYSCHPKNKPRHSQPYLDAYCGARPTPENPRGMQYDWHWWTVDDRPGPVAFRLPYAPGDRLWVQEECILTQFGKPVYRADACDWSGARWISITPGDPEGEVLWGAAKMMEREHSRLTLTVTDVRVQRVQEISEEDAIAEGCRGYVSADGEDGESPVEQLQDLWNSIHGPDAWAANPWVVAYSFTVQQRNIDAEAPDA